MKKMKAMLRETKENVQGTNSDGKETGTQINSLEQKEETFNQNRMKKQEFKKMRRGLGTFQDIFKCSNIQIIGVPKEKRKNKKLKTYLNK